MTATDIVVAGNSALEVGDPAKVAFGVIAASVLRGAKYAIRKLLEDVVDRMS